ncbi:unnamed protein product [Cuscuta campestris]|uniref:Secreted protein n=1 Tax=Cuscuta campestris TaxID=132261 RepID=A0A484MSS9_9ASTE|nr:unnamed protein product [Cuscuta campestris]
MRNQNAVVSSFVLLLRICRITVTTTVWAVNLDKFLQNGDLCSEQDNVARRVLEQLIGFPVTGHRRNELSQGLDLVRHRRVRRSSVFSGAELGSPAGGRSSPRLCNSKVASDGNLFGSHRGCGRRGGGLEEELTAAARRLERERGKKKEGTFRFRSV